MFSRAGFLCFRPKMHKMLRPICDNLCFYTNRKVFSIEIFLYFLLAG